MCWHGLDVLGETNRLSIPTSESELFCKSSTEASAHGEAWRMEGEGRDASEK